LSQQKIIDLLRTELRRQAKDNPNLVVARSDKPDNLHVIGEIDLYALAKAITNR
jgi:hypothetical protein